MLRKIADTEIQKHDDTETAAPPWTPEARLALARDLWDWEPHDGQRDFLTLRLADGSEPRVLVAACGRRWGKTEALGMDVCARILTEPELGQMGVAPTRDQAAGLFDSVEEKLRDAMENPAAVARFPHLRFLEIRQSPYPQVRRKDTGQMVFSVRAASGRNGRNLRGRGTTRKIKRFRVIVDERAFVCDAAVEEAIKPMLATMPGGGQLVEISTPYGRRGGFYDDYLKGERQEKRFRSVRLPSSQNPLLDHEYLEAMQEEMTPTRFATEFLAEFHDRAGAVFSDDDITAALCDDDYGDAPLWGCRYVAGVDFGRRHDYTVIAVLEVAGKTMRLVHLSRFQGLTWAGQTDRICEAVARWKPARLVTDGTGIGDAITEAVESAFREKRITGCAVEKFVFSGTSKPYLIDSLAVALSQRRLRFPPHPTLLSELRNFEATPTPSGREILEAAGSGHDDTVCALALARHAAGPLLATSAGTRIALGGLRSSSLEKETEFSPCLTQPSAPPPAACFPASGVLLRLCWKHLLPVALHATVYRFAPLRRAGGFLAHRSTAGAKAL